MRSTRSSAVLSPTTASSLLVALACAACRPTSSDCSDMFSITAISTCTTRTASAAVFVDAFNPLRQLRQQFGRLGKQQHDRHMHPPPPLSPSPSLEIESPSDVDPSPLSVPAADLYTSHHDDKNGDARVISQVALPVEDLIIPPAEEADAIVDNDLDAVVLPSLGDDSSESPELADTAAAHDHSHSTSSERSNQREHVRRRVEDPISTGDSVTFSDPASAAEHHDVPSALDNIIGSSSKNDARAHKEELLHRSLLQTRFQLDARRRNRSQSLLLSETATAEGTNINSLRQKVSKVQQRVRSLPLFQLNSTSDLVAEVAPPDGLGEILSRNTTLGALTTRCVESSLSSAVDLIISVLFACRAVYRTVRSDGEVRNIWQCAGGTIGTAARRCLHSGQDHLVVQSETPEGALLAKRTKIIVASAGVAVSSIVLSMWAFVLGVACSSEACRGIGALRDSAREASAAVLFGAATIVRAVGALGRDIVSRIRAAQLPVDLDT